MTTQDIILLIESEFGIKNTIPTAKLVGDIGLSSFQIMMLLCEMEEHFHIRIPINKINNTITVENLINLSMLEVTKT